MICFFFLKKTTTTTTHSQINIKNKREVLLVKNQNKTKYASGLWLVFFFFSFSHFKTQWHTEYAWAKKALTSTLR